MPITRTWTTNPTTGRAEVSATGSYGAATGQPTDDDLTAIAALATTAFGRALLTAADAAALRTAASAQPLDSDLTSIAALTTTSFGRGLLDDADAAAALATIGAQASDSDLTSIAALSTTSFGRSLLATADAAALLTAAGAQPVDSDLTSIAALTTTSYGRGLLALANVAALRAEILYYTGTGLPEGVTTAVVGAKFSSTDKGRLFVKQRGTGNTGWSDAGGRGYTLPTGVFIMPPHNGASTSIFAADGEVRYTPVYFPHACTISEVAVECQTGGSAGSVARIGLFKMNSSLQPGALVADFGTVATTAVQACVVTGGAAQVEAGWYFFAVAQQGAPATRATLRTATGLLELPPMNSGSGTAAAYTAPRSIYVGTGTTGAYASTPTVSMGTVDPFKVQYKISSAP